MSQQDHTTPGSIAPEAASHVATKFTPGPWTVERDYPRRLDLTINARRYRRFVHVECRQRPDEEFDPPREEAIANAHLIAAAPDLYAALKAAQAVLCERSCGGGHHCGECTDALAAIEKAEGRSHD